MERDEFVRFVIPVVIVLIAILAVVILGNLVSSNPDGFEWALFEFAHVSEPTGGFEGIWAFLGEGPLVEVVAGALGVIIALMLGLLLFRAMARKER